MVDSDEKVRLDVTRWNAASTLDAALRYATSLGWALLPIEPGDKRPASGVLRRVHGHSNWSPFRERPASPPEVRAWVECEPEIGIGVITGAVSRLVVVDVDRPGAVPLTFPHAPVATTQRGFHVFFDGAEGANTSRSSWGEIRGDGALVVLPPSLNSDGSRRMWRTPPTTVLPAYTAWNSTNSPIEGVPAHPFQSQNLEHTPSVQTAVDRLGPEAFRGQSLASWWAREDVAGALCTRIGISLEQNCLCVLHPERRPSARVWRDRRGHYVYSCHHRRSEAPAMPLPVLYASALANYYVPLNSTSLAVWSLRALHAAGVLEPADVRLPPLPPNSWSGSAVLRDAVQLLFGLRWCAYPEQPVTLTASFLGPWARMTRHEVDKAKAELIDTGVIKKTGTCLIGKWPASLYMPGSML